MAAGSIDRDTEAQSADAQIRVHIVGCPRSGTTLLTELMRYAYDFAGAADHERSLFDPIPADRSPYLSKKPADTIRIEKAFLKDPNLYVIALLRDPRAVITSVHWSHPEVYFVGFKRWLIYADLIERLDAHPRYLMLRYEDLLADPNGVQDRLDEFLPFLTRSLEFARYPEGIDALHEHAEKALGGVRPFDTSRIEAWREHLGRIASEYRSNPDFQAALERFGYESDAEWADCLTGVQASGTSYKDAGDRFPKRLEIGLRYWWKTRYYLGHRLNR